MKIPHNNSNQPAIYLYIAGKKIRPGLHNVKISGKAGTPEEQMQALRALGNILYDAYTNSGDKKLWSIANE